MIVGIPVELSLQDTNVPEPTQSLAEYTKNGQRPIFGEDLELTDGSAVFRYTDDTMWSPPIWSQSDETKGVYSLGDVVWKDNKMQRVASVITDLNTQIPLQPDEYGKWDENIDHTTWKERYFRIPATQNRAGWMAKQWKFDGRWYYMFWENRGKCFGWRWSAKDMLSAGARHYTHYLRTCLAPTYSNRFEVGKDIMAILPLWKGRNSNVAKKTIQFKSIIERDGYFYMRTNIDLPIRYKNPSAYTYQIVKSPSDINGFRWNRLVAGLNPFDGKNYTATKIEPEGLGGYASWTLLSSGELDGIAFGHVVADYINIRFLDGLTGAIIDEVLGFTVDNSIDVANPSREYYASFAIYSKARLPSETIIQIEVYGEEVTMGEIMGIDTLDAGFTKATFKNKYRDFSPKDQDQWGNITYVNGVRVQVHSGTVDFPMLRYDQLNRLVGLVSGNKVFIDGSDAKDNQRPNGVDIFEATQMIGSFTSFDIIAAEKNKHIGDKASWTFTFEEIV